MCRAKASGEYRRCNHKSIVGKQVLALQAKKQYHAKHNPEKVEEITRQLHALQTLNKQWKEHATPFAMDITPATAKIIDTLEDAGFQPYIVGGSVRDQILGKNSKDIDIEVYGGTSDEIAKSLRKLGKVDEVGESFGVLKIVLDGEDFDVSLPRTESKAGEGHRGFDVSVDHNLTPEVASSRRDFTINALMYSPTHKVIVDFHGGLEDVENKSLRPVSDAFKDDPLRVLRGVQMAARFGYSLHPETVEVSRELKNEFSTLSTERVHVEFQKLYQKGSDVSSGFKALKDTEWDEHFSGLTEVNNENLWKQIDVAQEKVNNGYKNREVIFSAVVASNIQDSKARREFLSETCLGDDVKNKASHLVEDTGPSSVSANDVRFWVKDLKRGLTVEDWVTLQEVTGKPRADVEKAARETGVWDGPERDWVSGNDVMSIYNQKPGPWVRDVLDRARTLQYDRSVTTRDDLLAKIRSWVS